jgi:hypothetical protein
MELSLGFAHNMQSRMSTDDNITPDTTWCMQLSMLRAYIEIDNYPNPNTDIEPKHHYHHHNHLLSSVVILPVNISNPFPKLDAFVREN